MKIAGSDGMHRWDCVVDGRTALKIGDQEATSLQLMAFS
jgi:hypothetical protein